MANGALDVLLLGDCVKLEDGSAEDVITALLVLLMPSELDEDIVEKCSRLLVGEDKLLGDDVAEDSVLEVLLVEKSADEVAGDMNEMELLLLLK